MFNRRPRIGGFDYVGFHRYSVTACTRERALLFTDAALIDSVLLTIRQSAATYDLAIFAYCFMPDHLHLVVCATAERADLQRFVFTWKQASGFAYRRQTGNHLWQPSYFDHVLRDDEATSRHVKYVLENPVRKGLVCEFSEYPYSGSDVFTMDELKELWRDRQD